MDRFLQPPDPPEEGNCPNCKTWIHESELRGNYCVECEDMEKDDFLTLWHGRPKNMPLSWIECPVYVFNFNSFKASGFVYTNPEFYRPTDFRNI